MIHTFFLSFKKEYIKVYIKLYGTTIIIYSIKIDGKMSKFLTINTMVRLFNL
jgi:hypothetical protein